MDTRSPVTNQQVAKDLGVTHSMVSRIRSGERLPSLDLMRTIAERLDWDLQGQSDARVLGSYAYEFENALVKAYG